AHAYERKSGDAETGEREEGWMQHDALLDQAAVDVTAQREHARERARHVLADGHRAHQMTAAAAVVAVLDAGDHHDAVALGAARRLEHELVAAIEQLRQLPQLVGVMD